MNGLRLVRHIWSVSVNGAYGPWSAWSSCTKTCGGGVQSRSRECNDPVPDPDGLPCVGPSNDTEACNVDVCPGSFYRLFVSPQSVCRPVTQINKSPTVSLQKNNFFYANHGMFC